MDRQLLHLTVPHGDFHQMRQRMQDYFSRHCMGHKSAKIQVCIYFTNFHFLFFIYILLGKG